MEKLKVVYESIGKITPYERNARVHDETQIDQIVNSIKEFGFTNPILIDANNIIVAGHGRYEAALKLGMEMVPTIKLGHLTNEQRRAYTIADNQIALNSSWDLNLLQLEIGELQQVGVKLELIGLDDFKLKDLFLDHDKDPKEIKGGRELDESEFSNFDHQCPKCGFEFNDNP